MELRLLAAALRRQFLTVLVTTALGLLLALRLLASPTDTYAASATLLLDPLAVTTPLGQQFTGDPERYVSGQMRVLQGKKLARSASVLVPGQSAASLRRAVSVNHVVGSDLVDVTAEARDPSTAQALANAVVDTYVKQRRDETAAASAAVLAQVDEEIRVVEEGLRALPATGPAVEGRRGFLLAQYQQLLERRRTVAAPGATRDQTQVIDPASRPTSPNRLPRGQTLAAGAGLGLLAGLGITVLLEALRPRVTTRRQLQRMTDLPGLTFKRGWRHRSLGAHARVKALLPTARTLAVYLSLVPTEDKRRVVGVTSVRPGADCSSVALSVAVAFADQGRSVVLLRGPSRTQHRPTADAGLSVLQPGRPGAPSERWEEGTGMQIEDSQWPGVSTATWTGDRPLTAEDIVTAVGAVPPQHDVVVLDLPPVLDVPVASGVSSWVDDLVMLVRIPHELEEDANLAHALLMSNSHDLRLVTVPIHVPLRLSSRP
jgi:capsular polysaccharide biosynthesis protein